MTNLSHIPSVRKRMGPSWHPSLSMGYESGFRTQRPEPAFAIPSRMLAESWDNAQLEIRKMALLGYARVSTEDQKLDLQIDALKRAGCESRFIYQEKASGAKAQRPELGRMMDALRQGDVVVVYKLDRLSRSTTHLYQMVAHFEEQDIGFKSITESIDTTTAMGKCIFGIFAAMAQLERDLISERTKAGLRAARARGRKGGRRPKLDENKAKQAAKLLDDNPSLTHEDAARLMGVARATLYRAWERHGINIEKF